MKTRMLYVVCLIVAGLMSAHDGCGQITTMFYGKNKIESKWESAALYSVKIYPNQVHVTVELTANKSFNPMNQYHTRLTYWTSVKTVLICDGGMELPIIGFLRKVNGKEVIDTEPFFSEFGWRNVRKGEKHYYTMVFEGKIPPGCTRISIKDYGDYKGDHGYGFSNYTINNPPISSTAWTESSVKRYADENNDGICGIYEASDKTGYKLGCVKQNGEYILIYLGSKSKMSWWKMGDKKATLRPSATTGFFKADWLMADKSVNSDFYVVFDGGSMKAVGNSEETFYLKMYPVATSSASPTQTENWSGSGFALNNGYVCTNYHVVEGAKSIKIYGVNGDFSFGFSATVVATDKINDLAILKMTYYGSSSAIPYSVKTTMDEVGEEVFVLGYPLTATMGDEVKLTTGVISSRTGFQGDVSMYQISAPVQPGSSGGPLFDSSGNLIGIVNSRHIGAENVSYAIKTSYLQKLVNLSLSTDILPENNLISSLPLTGKVSNVKNYVYYIECSSKSYIFSSNRATPSTNHSGSSGNSGSGVSTSTNSPIVSSATGDGTSPSSHARIDVSNPYVKNSPRGLTIKRVRVTDTRTIIDLEYDNNTSIYDYGWWVNISLSSYIIVDNWYKVTLTKADGIPIAPEKHYFSAKNEKLQFTLVFPTLPSGTTEFDLIESAESPWKFYGIRLK